MSVFNGKRIEDDIEDHLMEYDDSLDPNEAMKDDNDGNEIDQKQAPSSTSRIPRSAKPCSF